VLHRDIVLEGSRCFVRKMLFLWMRGKVIIYERRGWKIGSLCFLPHHGEGFTW
jgi:hypothetical protein